MYKRFIQEQKLKELMDAKELMELREWYAEFKDVARQFGREQTAQLIAQDWKIVLMYERLIQLEIEVGTYQEERIPHHILY